MPHTPGTRSIRVLVVDDSPTTRMLLVSILESDPQFRVIGEATNGAQAIEKALTLRPDLISMDIHMPVVDGLEATKEIMRESPTPIIIVSASAVPSDVALALSATRAGALTVVEKPGDPQSPDFERQRDQLLSMARAMAGVKVVRGLGSYRATRSRYPFAGQGAGKIRLVAIGTSTGGPAALHRIFLDVGRNIPVPVVVVQHMAHGFMAGLVDWLGTNGGLKVALASDGDSLANGVVYLAPDDSHLGVTADGRATLFHGPPIGGFRPAADHLFDSCSRAFGPSVLAVTLTGMGRDGVDGLRTVKASGGYVLAQDEPTSIVYGMAQEAVDAGLVDEVLPLDRIGSRIRELVGAERE
jgi:two-component system chemotaxis response regulator CheB